MNGLIRLPNLADVDFFGGLALGVASACGVLVVLIAAFSGGIVA